MSDAARNDDANPAQPDLWMDASGSHGAETGVAGNPDDEIARMLAELQCSRLHVYREKPLYAQGYLGSIELQPGENLDFDAIAAEWGGGTLRFRPLDAQGRFLRGSKTFKFSGPPKYQGGVIRPDGTTAPASSAPATMHNPGPSAMTVRAAIPQSKDPAVNALADIVSQLLAQLAGGRGGADPAAQLSGYAKSLAEAQKLLNPPDDDDDDEPTGATGMDPSALMMMMMMNQGGGAGGPNPMMMLLPQLMSRGGGGGGLGGIDPMMMMMMMNQGGGTPPGMAPPMFPPQPPPPQQYAPVYPQQQPYPQQPPQQQGGGMNPAMMAWLMQQQQAQQQAAQRAQQQQRPPTPPPAAPPQQQAPPWPPEPEPEPEPEPQGYGGPRPVDDADPYKF